MPQHVLGAHVDGLGESVDELEIGDVADDLVALFFASDDLSGNEIDVLNLPLVDDCGVDGLVLPRTHGKLNVALPSHLELCFFPVWDDVGKPEVRVDGELEGRGGHRRADNGLRVCRRELRAGLDEAEKARYKRARSLVEHLLKFLLDVLVLDPVLDGGDVCVVACCYCL